MNKSPTHTPDGDPHHEHVGTLLLVTHHSTKRNARSGFSICGSCGLWGRETIQTEQGSWANGEPVH